MTKYLALIILLYLVLISRYFSYVPMWDAWDNAGRWIYQAVTLPFNPFNFDHGGHPSMVYFLILGLGQYLDLGNQYLIHLTNALLTALSIAAFYGTINRLFPQIKRGFEAILLTFLYAFFPIIIGNSLHVNPDYGVMVFFVIFLYFILREKPVLATIFAIPMIFSKEAGIVIYFLTLFPYFTAQLLEKRKTGKPAWRIIRKNFFLWLPFLLFLLRYFIKTVVLHEPVLWIGAKSIFVSNDLTAWPWWQKDKIPWSYFLGIFVINFNWILSIFIFLGLGYFFIRGLKKREYLTGWILGLFFSLTLVLTFFKTFTNLRYFLPLYPMMILLFYYGLKSVVADKLIRRMVLIAVAAIFFLSNFYTLDPVSKKIYGTFKFGRHDMLKMTSITHECCGYGRDQLVYNLQYLNIPILLDEIFAVIKPNEETALAYQPLLGPAIFPKITRGTSSRTLKNFAAFNPKIVNWNFDLLPEIPQKLYYLEFPNAEMGDDFRHYLNFYRIVKTENYEHMDYSMKVYLLERKV